MSQIKLNEYTESKLKIITGKIDGEWMASLNRPSQAVLSALFRLLQSLYPLPLALVITCTEPHLVNLVFTISEKENQHSIA